MRLLGLGNLGIPGALDTIAATIQQVEGYYTSTLAYVNNNPGNLVYTPYYAQNFSAVQGSGGYSKFPDYSTGYAALQNQIILDAAKGMSISDLTYSWLGSGTGGNAPAYATSIANALGVDPSTSVQSLISDTSTDLPPVTVDPTTGLSIDPSAGSNVNTGALIGIAVAALVGILVLSR